MSAAKILLAVLGVFVLAGLAIVLWAVGSYNGLVTLQQATDKQWAQVQSVYQRRADLIPNLVSTVAGAANFEKSTLTAVTEARASVGRVQLPPNTAPADASQRLLVVSERYPQLTATANFRDLQAQLEGTENRISVERGRFNDAVQAYDTAIRRFPGVIMAGIFGFAARPYFTAAPGAETAPKVDFGGKF
jgi:LemA protein